MNHRRRYRDTKWSRIRELLTQTPTPHRGYNKAGTMCFVVNAVVTVYAQENVTVIHVVYMGTR